MPITPSFKLSQTASSVEIEIAVPHIRVHPEQTQALLTDRSVFHFASPPVYLLVLNFAPYEFEEEDLEAQYQNGVIRVVLQKTTAIPYENLDLIGKLKQPKETTSRWLKQVETDNEDTTGTFENELCESSPSGLYGFARMFRNIFIDLNRDGLAREMLEIPVDENLLDDPESFRVHRTEQRISVETSKFDADRYLGDFFGGSDDYLYQCALAMKPHWMEATVATFTESERNQLMSIPYPLLPKDLPDTIHFGILDILFAYVYDHLLTDGEPNVESAWTISILSASLSTLSEFGSTESVVISSLRRCLIYPYLRRFDFGIYVLKQVVSVLKSDIRTLVRCFLHTRSILEHSELYYLGNKLYLDPYLKYLQDMAPNLAELGDEVNVILENDDLKECLNLNLISFESEAVGKTIERSGETVSSCEDSLGDSSPDDDSSSSSPFNPPPVEDVTEELSRGLLDLSINPRPQVFRVDQTKHSGSKTMSKIQELD